MAVKMISKYTNTCAKCGGFIATGTPIVYDKFAAKKVWHQACPTIGDVYSAPVEILKKMIPVLPRINALSVERARHANEAAMYEANVSIPEIAAALYEINNMMAALEVEILALRTPAKGDLVRATKGTGKVMVGASGFVCFSGIGKFGPVVAFKDGSGATLYLKPGQVEVVERPE